MPTARELLEQADALMRRNRKRGKGKHGGPPTLTDALGIDRGTPLAPTVILAPAAEADPIALDTLSDLPVLTDAVDVWLTPPAAKWPADDGAAPAAALDDALEADALAAGPPPPSEPQAAPPSEPQATPPSEPQATPRSEAEATPVQAALRGHAPQRIEDGATSVHAAPHGEAREAEAPATEPVDADGERRGETGGSPSAVAPTPASVTDAGRLERTASRESSPFAPVQDEEFILDIPPASDAARASAPDTAAERVPQTPPPLLAAAESTPALAPGSLEWDALAEEIRMQVLQRLDLFTDTGMRDQLGARLQPIVARASAELVETINHALGELVRGYVAEAIEREIESWRKRSG